MEAKIVLVANNLSVGLAIGAWREDNRRRAGSPRAAATF